MSDPKRGLDKAGRRAKRFLSAYATDADLGIDPAPRGSGLTWVGSLELGRRA